MDVRVEVVGQPTSSSWTSSRSGATTVDLVRHRNGVRCATLLPTGTGSGDFVQSRPSNGEIRDPAGMAFAIPAANACNDP